VGAAGAALAYAVTPYSALGLEGVPIATGSNARYAVPALLLAAPAAAWLVSRAGAARPWLEALLVLATLDALRRGVGSPAGDDAAAVALLAAAAIAAAWLARAPGAARVRRVLIVAVVLGGVAVTGLYAVQTRALDDRYADAPPAVAAALERADAGSKIGVAGAWPVTTLSPILPLFGPRLDNDVDYVGELRDHLLVPYRSRRAFATAVEGAGYDLLLVGDDRPLGYPREPLRAWAEDAGYRRVTADADFTLLAR
jgi:hypothetical protein